MKHEAEQLSLFGGSEPPRPDRHRKERCPHETTTIVLTPESPVHYGKEVCTICGCYIKWVKTPSDTPKS